MEVIPMAVDARYRDKDGEISRKHGNTLIGTLRVSYGSGFAKGLATARSWPTSLRSWMNGLFLSWFATIKLAASYKAKDSLGHSAPGNE
jgi:hypothetical protein